MNAIPRESKYPMIDMEEAISMVISHANVLEPILLPIQSCSGHILAAGVHAPEPIPPFPASVKDGYAVVASDGPGEYDVLGQSVAGSNPSFKVTSGSVAYITTGAPVPEGADAVVQVEWTKAVPGDPNRVVIEKAAPKPGHDVRQIGSDIQKGQVVLEKGEKLNAAEIGILASCNISEVLVIPSPRVAVLSTGDELCEVGQQVSPGKIIDSNRPMLLSALKSVNAVAIDAGIACDTLDELRDSLGRVLENCDMLVTSGGISMGNRDLIKTILEQHGTIHFGRVLMKPGKPLTFATIKPDAFGPGIPSTSKLVLGLPGNPVSSFVCFHLAVVPALRVMGGWDKSKCRGAAIQVCLMNDIKLDPERPEYHRATVQWKAEDSKLVAFSTGIQASSRLLSTRSSNALLVLPRSDESLKVGALVQAILIGDIGG